VAVVSARIEQFRTIPSGITWSAYRLSMELVYLHTWNSYNNN
jgi:hypothetical protein